MSDIRHLAPVCFSIHVALALAVLCGCSHAPAQRADSAAIKRQVAAEVARICALPEPRRAEEIERVQHESHIAIVCPRP